MRIINYAPFKTLTVIIKRSFVGTYRIVKIFIFNHIFNFLSQAHKHIRCIYKKFDKSMQTMLKFIITIIIVSHKGT